MNIENDPLKQILSYHQALDGTQFCRQVLRNMEQRQKQRRWIMTIFFSLGCVAALLGLFFAMPAGVFSISSHIITYAGIAVGVFILWVIFEEFGFIR